MPPLLKWYHIRGITSEASHHKYDIRGITSAQATAPGLFGGFLSWWFEKTEGGGFKNPLHSPEERTQ